MKETINWYPKDYPFTKDGEILLHEKTYKQKTQKVLLSTTLIE